MPRQPPGFARHMWITGGVAGYDLGPLRPPQGCSKGPILTSRLNLFQRSNFRILFFRRPDGKPFSQRSTFLCMERGHSCDGRSASSEGEGRSGTGKRAGYGPRDVTAGAEHFYAVPGMLMSGLENIHTHAAGASGTFKFRGVTCYSFFAGWSSNNGQ